MLLSRVFDIVAPESAPQICVPPLGGVAHPLAPAVMAAMRQHGISPVGLWRIINSLANSRNADYRARRRCWRLRYWGACRELLNAKLLFRHGGYIATSNFATRPSPRSQGRRPTCPMNSEVHLLPTVGALTGKTGGSKPVTATAETAGSESQVAEAELVAGSQTVLPSGAEAKSATPAVAEVSAAAAALARLPRRPKRWSGWLNDRVRTYRNMRVELPSGEQVYVFGARRGLLVYVREHGACAGDADEVRKTWDVLPTDRVQVIRNEAAQLLGSHKRGVRERPSPLKAASARRNGCSPCRGGRKRGRPPKGRQASTASKRA